MGLETITRDDLVLAEVLRHSIQVQATKFFSPDESDLQIGIMAHPTGFVEATHFHPVMPRRATATQQFFYVVKGRILVNFFLPSGDCDYEIELCEGDSIVILNGIHSIKVLEESKCITVKQGPFLGPENDKIEVLF